MKYYVAYGSNLNMAQMAIRCPGAKPLTTALLEDTALVFRGNARGTGVATVEHEPGSCVPIGIWKITEKDEKALDRYEGAPWLYHKKTVLIHVDGKPHRALIYIMAPGHQIAAPSSGYLQTIIQGYRDFGFDPSMLLRPVADTDPSRKGVR